MNGDEKCKNLGVLGGSIDRFWHTDATPPSGPKYSIKFRDFKNPRWRRPLSWKFEKSQYLRNVTTDFDEVWYSDAPGPSRYRQQIKIYDFENPRWRRPPSWKMEKNLMSSQPIDRFWQNLARWCVLTLSAPIANKISQFQKIQDGGNGHFENSKNCNISTTRRPILTTFSTLMSLCLPDSVCQWNFTNLKIQDGGVRHFEKLTNLKYLCNRLTDFAKIWHTYESWSSGPC